LGVILSQEKPLKHRGKEEAEGLKRSGDLVIARDRVILKSNPNLGKFQIEYKIKSSSSWNHFLGLPNLRASKITPNSFLPPFTLFLCVGCWFVFIDANL
jgi:hypothetical protein